MDTLMGRYRNVSILAAAVFIQLVGLAVQVKRATDTESSRLIRIWAVSAVTPLEKVIVRVQGGAGGLWHEYIYLRGVRQQNRDLQQQIQQLQLEQVRLRQDAQQARRLQALLGFKEQFIDQTVAAQVIGSSGSEQSRTVYLDKGSDDGISTTGMAVVSASGVVGKVIEVFRHTSQVLLINDQTSGVGAILEQSRLQGVLKGRPSGEIVLDKIMAEEEVKVGERVLTSGGDQIFPKGMPIGTVTTVTRGSEFLQVKVQPGAALNHLEEVLVITKKAEREPAGSPATPLRAADILAQRLPSVPDKPEEKTPETAPGTAKLQQPKSVTVPGASPKLPAATGAPGEGTSAIAKKQDSAPAAKQPATAQAPPSNLPGSRPAGTSPSATQPKTVPTTVSKSPAPATPPSDPGETPQ